LAGRAEMKRGVIVCLALVFFPLGCGYFEWGTWEDDSDNWERAFGTSKPDDVVVMHSKYWRSAHWTYECEYFFEIQRNEEFRKQLFGENELVRLEEPDAIRAKGDCFGEVPEWFAPKPGQEYEVWQYADEPKGHFRLFVDKQTGNLFLTDYQI
jgi:hypothetical protein